MFGGVTGEVWLNFGLVVGFQYVVLTKPWQAATVSSNAPIIIICTAALRTAIPVILPRYGSRVGAGLHVRRNRQLGPSRLTVARHVRHVPEIRTVVEDFPVTECLLPGTLDRTQERLCTRQDTTIAIPATINDRAVLYTGILR